MVTLMKCLVELNSAGNWNDWVKYATTSQLSNYVAKSGDTMDWRSYC